jgi:hypothetical protein
MNENAVKDDFKRRVCEQIDLEPEGNDRYRVLTPFRFEDGDHLGIVLKRDASGWFLSDEAHTMMHLSYWLDEQDIDSGNRHEIVQNSLATFSVENRNGEFVIPVSGERFGDALFNFIQALTKVSDVSFLTRERVRSTFMEDFWTFFESHVPAERLAFDWTDPIRDPKGHYPVDCRINGMPRPLFVYALPGETRVKDATIYLLKFEQWNIPFQSMGVFEEQENIHPKTLARFTDVCEKTFSSLAGNTDRIETYLKRTLGSR